MSTGTLLRGTSAFDTTTPKFGTAALAGGAYSTASTDSFLAAGDGSLLTTGTVEGWVKTTAAGPRVAVGHDNWYWLGVNGGMPTAHYGGSSVETTITGSSAVNDGLWHHIALVLVSGAGSLYVDGTRVATSGNTPTTGTSSSSSTLIGGFGANAAAANYPQFDWAGAGGGTIDEVRLSNVARYSGTTYTVPTAPFTVDASTKGLYHLDGDATDSTVSPPADTTAPTVPTALTVGTPTASTVPLSWTASTDAVGVAGYRVRRGGALVGSPTATNYTDTGLTASTAYSYTVSAVDAAGNESAQTSAVTGTTAAAAVTVNIAPNDTNIVYSPYTWLVGSASAKTINAGAYFRALIQGGPTAVAVKFDLTGVASPLPQVTVYVDGYSMFSGAIAASLNVALPAGNTWGKHLVEVVIKAATETQPRWSTQSTAVIFTGIATTPNTCTTNAIQTRVLRGIVYGDSITEGVRTLNQTATSDVDRNDATLGWAYALTKELGAEIGVVGFGATGLTAAGSGGVPALPTSYNLLWAGQARSFTPVPDFIVWLEGTNDGTTNTVAAATTALNGLLAATPSATKIVVLRPLNGTSQAANLQAAIAACSVPSRVSYVDTAGWWSSADASDALHPYGYTNLTSIAPRVAAAVRTAITPTAVTAKRFINKAGNAVPIG